MTRFYIILLSLTVPMAILFPQGAFPSYYSQEGVAFTSPGAMKFGLYGFDNPASLNDLNHFDMMLVKNDARVSQGGIERSGVFLGLPNIGFGYANTTVAAGSVSDYRLALAGGSRMMGIGISYGWSGGDKSLFNRTNNVSIGALLRPNRYVSVGGVATASTLRHEQEGVLEAAGRPLGNELLSAFADYGWADHRLPGEARWSGGVAVEALPGIRVTARYFDTKEMNLGFQFSIGRVGAGAQTELDKNRHHVYNSYSIRLGAYDRNIIDSYFRKKENYVDLNLLGQISYQKYQWFDNSKTLSELLAAIAAAQSDPSIAGIAINTSGLSSDREKLWELREQLREFKKGGKKVVIFIDRAGIDLYHFASVADKIIMDPDGTVMLDGYIFGRTYVKGTLEKLGIGFDEWRFFKYKSANEGFSRDKMSDADREQWQKLTDDEYRLAKSDICEGRKISPYDFDTLVNNEVMFLPQQAMEKGLIDTIGRWDKVVETAKGWSGGGTRFVGSRSLIAFNKPQDDYWGEKPRIAVIYALGVCSMDEGISARRLVKDVNAAVQDPLVKAIVLRVDSPGGDGMASDYIAEALRKAKGIKPVIVSQGFVAGSGGYWLSMYGDTIVAAPTTITGSIGVIGGFFYNKGIKESLGMSTDLVKTGLHADLGFGFTFPFIGVGIPDRNLTTEERARAEFMIKAMYKEFTAKVASGRKMTQDAVDSVGQGRVWSGYDGKSNGLVDVLGGLETSIAIAKEKAGLKKEDDVTIIELPVKGLFDMSGLGRRFLGFETPVQNNTLVDQLKFRLEHNGEAMPMMPFDDVEAISGTVH